MDSGKKESTGILESTGISDFPDFLDFPEKYRNRDSDCEPQMNSTHLPSTLEAQSNMQKHILIP